jgi:hypothetical protein
MAVALGDGTPVTRSPGYFQGMDDEARPGTTAVTLPEHVAARRARGAERVAAAGVAGFVGIFGLVKAKRTEAFDLAVTMRWQATRCSPASWNSFRGPAFRRRAG